jgi:outer membrane protein insertion porin family
MFRNVRTYRKAVKGGVEVTFEVFELPIIRYVRFEGNKKIKDKTLLKRSELAVGESLHRYRLEEAGRKLKELYIERGFSDADVQIREGNEPGDKGVVFSIYEGKQQRIFRTRFEGNTIVTDGRLKTQIQSKPGLLWIWKGKVDRDKIEADRERIVSYYRSLGYFTARVGRYLAFDDSGKWLTLTFVIDEGPRYRIRNVSLVGNKTFTTESLESRLQLTSGDYFDARKMNADLNALRETYGGEGYIHSDINADPRFLEEPGTIDLVYDIDEGEQYRVGRIIVNIEGENPHTRRNVVINRLSLAPNDIININEVRASERRLRSSQLFKTDPASGVSPTIAIRSPELGEGPAVANQPDRSGGSPY